MYNYIKTVFRGIHSIIFQMRNRRSQSQIVYYSKSQAIQQNEQSNKNHPHDSSQSYQISPTTIEKKEQNVSNVESISSSSIKNVENRIPSDVKVEPQRSITSDNYRQDRDKNSDEIYRRKKQPRVIINPRQFPSLLSSNDKDTQNYEIQLSRYQIYRSILDKEQAIEKRKYEFTNEDAKVISKKGFQQGEEKLTIEECRDQMKKQMHKLNTQYKYLFKYKESPSKIQQGKRMTRTIYLSFMCNKCNRQNRWTSIGGTFQVTFKYDRHYLNLVYHIEIYRTQCQHCLKYIEPKVYKTQMEAMKMFFSVIVTNIIENKPPPEKPEKYYIRPNHWHKEKWCEACKLGKCTTQNRK